MSEILIMWGYVWLQSHMHCRIYANSLLYNIHNYFKFEMSMKIWHFSWQSILWFGIINLHILGYKVGTGCKEAGEKNDVGNISGNLEHL
jgi:hypothetical protein